MTAQSGAFGRPTRIFVTGNAGSGKSTLAARLGRMLDLPVYGLDAIVWQPGWRKRPQPSRDAMIAELLREPAWVIEGVSLTVLQAADLVIFLDAPRGVCLLRCARRNWRHLFRSRPGLPERCPEILIIPKLVRLVWRFPAHVRPGILKAIALREAIAHVVRTNRDLEELFEDLAAAGALTLCARAQSLSLPQR